MNNHNPLVSVIIPTYNRSNHILGTIESALGQTYKNIEIIVVDDGSIDGTSSRVKAYGYRIRYVYQEHAGVSAARNKGIEEARGEFVAFLDSDDLWMPEKIFKQMELFKADPELSVIYTDYSRFDDFGTYALTTFQFKTPAKGRIRKELLKNNFIGTSTVILKRSVFNNLGKFDTRLSTTEDFDLWLRLSDYYLFDYIPEALVRYRISSVEHPANYLKHCLVIHRLLSRLTDDRETYLLAVCELSKYYYYAAKTALRIGKPGLAVGCFLHSIKWRPFETKSLIFLPAAFFLSLLKFDLKYSISGCL
jgi:glycosyltransferase involved in cell wall biosynthesis